MEKKTYTIFKTDLKQGADLNNPSLADINLTKRQISEAWSILYIRPDAKRIYLKNSDSPNRVYSRFEILKMSENPPTTFV